MEKMKEIEDLIISLFQGDGTEEDRLRLDDWLRQNEAHKTRYREIVNSYLHLRWSREEQLIDDEKSLQRIMGSLKKRKRSLWWVAAAASVVVIVCSVFILRYRSSDKAGELFPADISPIRAQAKLILSNGQNFYLSDQGESLLESDGSMLKIIPQQGLVYSADSAREKMETLYNTIEVPKGGEYFVVLSDGTEVWLNADTRLTFPVSFTGQVSREISLSGEAYIKVKKDSKPFRLTSGEYSLRVYGTEFNINTYNPQRIELALVEGSVGYCPNRRSPESVLAPNQLGVSNSITGETEITDTNIHPYIAWINKDMVFRNETLESIMEKISRWYDVEIFYQHEAVKSYRFIGDLPRYSELQDVFYFLEKASNARFKLKNRTVIVSETK